jgi:hypothetical protein
MGRDIELLLAKSAARHVWESKKIRQFIIGAERPYENVLLLAVKLKTK